MAMAQSDVDAARKALLQRKQAAYEALFNAIVAGDQTAKKAAKQAIGDCGDEDDALNNVQALINVLATMP